ncbi:ATP-binding cassette domain-containing protein [uncultured Bacteroides sp.]|uniref:ABC transporter ATP-binding protein n=1 Tax=uncultured Bacteroides sp. TaxID=162156 RepID=UPI002AA83EF2|nr:ATP-binding cassette domain-containing protein [uncultured Bacteroides sp.]
MITSIYIDVKRKMTTSEGDRTLHIEKEISGGEFICLVGHSGSGKTTLLRMLSGLVTPDEGMIRVGSEIWFDSRRKVNFKPQQRSIAYMFQDFALFPNMSVEENICFAQKKRDKTKVNELLNIFGMNGLAKQKPSKLSGGQKQRVALARALASSPSILLLDEPLSAIDQEMRNLLQCEILKAHEYLAATSIMVTHDMHEANHMATEIVKIKNGLIVEQDETDCTCLR